MHQQQLSKFVANGSVSPQATRESSFERDQEISTHELSRTDERLRGSIRMHPQELSEYVAHKLVSVDTKHHLIRRCLNPVPEQRVLPKLETHYLN